MQFKELSGRSIPVLLAVALGTLLTGCATNKFATVGAFCDALPRTDRAVQGRTRDDQVWIAGTQEAEIQGCGFERPSSVEVPSVKTKRRVAVRRPVERPVETQSAPDTNAPVSEPVAAVPSRTTRLQRIHDELNKLGSQLKKLEKH